MSLQSELLSCAGCFVCGALDSLRLHQTAVFFLTSNRLRVRFVQCLVLNGGIFLSSVLIAEHALAPLLNLLLAVGGGGPAVLSRGSSGGMLPAVPGGLSSLLLYVYYLVWVYPLYCISFILNSIWYQSIAEEAFSASGHRQPSAPASFRRWLRLMSEELYRLLLISCFVLQMAAFSLLPVIGAPLAFAHLCWLQALYSFDYHWSARSRAAQPDRGQRRCAAAAADRWCCCLLLSGACRAGRWRRVWSTSSVAGPTSQASGCRLRP
jgi:etoposide-induced 2.4 mRNA